MVSRYSLWCFFSFERRLDIALFRLWCGRINIVLMSWSQCRLHGKASWWHLLLLISDEGNDVGTGPRYAWEWRSYEMEKCESSVMLPCEWSTPRRSMIGYIKMGPTYGMYQRGSANGTNRHLASDRTDEVANSPHRHAMAVTDMTALPPIGSARYCIDDYFGEENILCTQPTPQTR